MPHPPDFDLAINTVGAEYTVRVQAAFGVGELPPQPFALPLDLTKLPQRRDVVEFIRQAQIRRLSGNEELRRAHDFGSTLFESLFTRDVLACFSESRGKLDSDQRLRLRLRLPPTLTSLPWELLYDRRRDEFLVLAPDLTFIRYPEIITAVTPLRVDGPLHVVAVLSSPSGYRSIKLDAEQQRIETALKGPRENGQIALEFIRGRDTLGQLRERLRQPVHILHMLCHGEINESRGEGFLIFEDNTGDAEKVSAESLRLQLQKQRGKLG
jgi:hypothetical protein